MGISALTCERISYLYYNVGFNVDEIAKAFRLREGTVRVILGLRDN